MAGVAAQDPDPDGELTLIRPGGGPGRKTVLSRHSEDHQLGCLDGPW